jgi:predicted kinase
MEAVIFIGIQGAGKSTFYKERFFDTHMRLNLDMLKTRHREQLLLKAFIEAKQSFVVDNTNVTREQRARYITAAKPARFKIIGYYFETVIEDAMKRNSVRSGKKRIPERGISATYKKLETPSLNEGFDLLYRVHIDSLNNFVVMEWSK